MWCTTTVCMRQWTAPWLDATPQSLLTGRCVLSPLAADTETAQRVPGNSSNAKHFPWMVSTCQNHHISSGQHLQWTSACTSSSGNICCCAASVSWLPVAVLQTGAGKTWTMSGDARNYSHRGIIPRALQHVFRDVDMRSDRIYSISVSYLEIYNESLRDLLADDPAAASDSLSILDDSANTVVGGDDVACCFLAQQGVSLVAAVVAVSQSLK